MTIKYALTRAEIVRSFFQSLGRSPQFLAIILMYSVGLSLFWLAMEGAFSRPFTLHYAIDALALMVGAFLFMPLWIFLRGKTGERTLKVSQQGISTEISSRKGQVSWNKVRVVSDTGRDVLIVGATGNAFFIPNRAFSGPDQRAQFIEQVNQWRNAE